jgi:hypothetical protein
MRNDSAESKNEALRRRYESLHDDELRSIASEGGLTEEAKAVLDRELGRRGIHDIEAYKKALDCGEGLRRQESDSALAQRDKSGRPLTLIGIAIALLLLLAGAYRLFVQDDTGGTGMVIAAALIAAFVLARRYVRRFVWQLLLRP